MSERLDRRAPQEPHLPNPYEPFVRSVLTRLAGELSDGRLSIRQEAGGARYVVEAPGHTGRDIVVPASEWLKPPSVMPPRSVKGLLSKLTIRNAEGSAINVPKSAIVRDYNVPSLWTPLAMQGVCRGCEFGTCPHGWAVRDIDPAGIVVLSLRSEEGFQVFGWYVRFVDTPKELVRIPETIIAQLADMMENDPVLTHSSLLTRYEDCSITDEAPEPSFHADACKRFARYRTRVCAAYSKDRKRKRPAMDASSGGGETCVICLEERPSAAKRCRHDSCGTHVCETCHSDSRGLCPVCDRSSINADYPCSSCHRLTRLRAYGFPCSVCNTHSLCSHCFSGFEACGACESA